jgi:acyl-coenzyme A thioesterase PaaI-like protein
MSSAWKTDSFIADSRALPLPDSEIAYFRSIPSLRPWLDDLQYSAIATSARIPRTDGECDLFAITLKTLATIPEWLLVVHNERTKSLPAESAGGGEDARTATDTEMVQAQRGPGRPDCLLMLKLGPGVNGFKDVAHGGLLCALLDEALSYCVEFARQARSRGRSYLYTANLNIDFRRPVVTPGVAVVKCWMTKVEGRKYWLEGQIEDGQENVCVQAKGLWIEAKAENL